MKFLPKPTPTAHPVVAVTVGVLVGALVGVVGAPINGSAAAKPTTKSVAAKTKTKPIVKRTTTPLVTNAKLTSTTVARPKSAVLTAVAGVTVLPPTTVSAPTSVAPLTTTSPPSTTTTAPTTTTSPVASFEVVALNTRADAPAGGTATISVVIAQRADPVAVSLSLIGLPSGTSASVSPNPTTGQAVIRIAVPSNAVVADYPLRVLGTGANAQSWANVTLGVLAASTTTTTPTSTSTTTVLDGSGLPASFGFTVTSDGKTLSTGGQVQYVITPIYDTGFNGSIEYFVSGLPDGVWHGFSEKVTTTKTTLWLSSTVPLKAGTFTFTVTGVAKGLKKSGEVTLRIA